MKTTQMLADNANVHGGFTYSPWSGLLARTGYAVACYPGHEVRHCRAMLTPDDIAGFYDAWCLDCEDPFIDGPNNPENHIGAWQDGDTWYLDVSRVVPDLETALQLAREHHQLAVYDLAEGRTIPVTP